MEHHPGTHAGERAAPPAGGRGLARCIAGGTGIHFAAAEARRLTGGRATVRVMTWNIHGGLGTDRRFDLSRVVEIISRHHPDVVALQEVDSRRTLAPARSAFAVLRE